MTTESKFQLFALRLALLTRAQATEIAEREGISLNQFILVALSEKIARLEFLHPGTLKSETARRRSSTP